jgi:hypothetical protein
MWNAERVFARVQEELARGDLWRAKEILQGNIRHVGYEPELYERYGRVLLRMEDLIEAGKYLFLSGIRTPEYERAISLYLARHAKGRSSNLIGSFPHQARLPDLNGYPSAVADALTKLGLASQFPRRVPHTAPARPIWRDPGFLTCMVIVLLGLVGYTTLVISIYSWASQ